MLSRKLPLAISKILFFCYVLVSWQTGLAQQTQEPCGFVKVHENLLKTDAQYREVILKDAQRWAKVNQNDFHSGRTEAPILRIPLVVHVMHLGEAL